MGLILYLEIPFNFVSNFLCRAMFEKVQTPLTRTWERFVKFQTEQHRCVRVYFHFFTNCGAIHILSCKFFPKNVFMSVTRNCMETFERFRWNVAQCKHCRYKWDLCALAGCENEIWNAILGKYFIIIHRIRRYNSCISHIFTLSYHRLTAVFFTFC